jgi:glyoxylase-like metal-dependent hydrolase (beta-lactamase superfamily II)
VNTADALAEDVGRGVYRIDALYLRPGLASSHLIVDGDSVAFVDTGHAPALPRLLGALQQLGLERAQVEYVFLTHVHLDHAGGAGQLMAALPNARAVVHPRGAPHMIDPTRLIAGSIEVYGPELYRQLYGELLPIPAERVELAPDGHRVQLGRRTLELIDTPGHARHHYCAVDREHEQVFTGDTFGLAYREFDTAVGEFAMTTTTPVQFDPVALHASIDRIMGLRPTRVVMTHFGPAGDLTRLAGDLHNDIEVSVRIARQHAAEPQRAHAIQQSLFEHFDTRLTAHGYTGDTARRHHFLDDDTRLNAAGLDVWLGKG